MSSEFHYLMDWGTQGVKNYTGDQAMANKVNEWFDTPRGAIYGNPNWGHQLQKFKHEPHSDTTADDMKSSIVIDIRNDIPDIVIRLIAVVPSGMDTYDVYLLTDDVLVGAEITIND